MQVLASIRSTAAQQRYLFGEAQSALPMWQIDSAKWESRNNYLFLARRSEIVCMGDRITFCFIFFFLKRPKKEFDGLASSRKNLFVNFAKARFHEYTLRLTFMIYER